MMIRGCIWKNCYPQNWCFIIILVKLPFAGTSISRPMASLHLLNNLDPYASFFTCYGFYMILLQILLLCSCMATSKSPNSITIATLPDTSLDSINRNFTKLRIPQISDSNGLQRRTMRTSRAHRASKVQATVSDSWDCWMGMFEKSGLYMSIPPKNCCLQMGKIWWKWFETLEFHGI